MKGPKYEKYLVNEFNGLASAPGIDPCYAEWAKRILWIDDKVVTGAFHFSCAWYLKPPVNQLGLHSHDYDEMLGFLGSNPADPYELGGEIEFCMEDETFVINRTCALFVPRGMKHSMTIKRVDRPILHMGSSRH